MRKSILALFLLACAAPMKQSWPEVSTTEAAIEKAVVSLGEFEMRHELPTYRPDPTSPLVELKAFDRNTVAGFAAKLAELDGKTREVWVRIDSPGGSIFGGQDVIHAMEAMRSKVVCVADWKAYSMAFYTLESPGCDLRLMTKRASLMAHEPSTESGGNSGSLRDDADLLDALNEGFLVTCAERMRIPVETLREKTERRTWWMDYREAQRWNAIDGWADPRAMPAPTPFQVKKSLLEMLLGG